MDYLELTNEIKEEVYNKIWKLVDDTYVFFVEKEIDWHSIRQEFYEKVNHVYTYVDFYQVINEMLLRLGDPHTQILSSPHDKNYILPLSLVNIGWDYFIDKNLLTNSNLVNGMKITKVNNHTINEFMSSIYDKYHFKSDSARKSAALKELLLQKTSTINLTAENNNISISENIQNINTGQYADNLKLTNLDVKNSYTKHLDKNITYFKIVNFTNVNLLNDFNNIINLSKNKSLILDVRGNRGGLIEETVKFTSLLLDEKVFVGYKLKRKINGGYTEFEEPISIELLPESNANLNFKNIIILCNEFTASSAEFIFLKALKKSRQNVKIIGTQTAGIIHGANIFTLFDGTRLSITAWKYLDENYVAFEEKGIEPDIQINNDLDFYINNNDAQLEAAIKLCVKSN